MVSLAVTIQSALVRKDLRLIKGAADNHLTLNIRANCAMKSSKTSTRSLSASGASGQSQIATETTA